MLNAPSMTPDEKSTLYFNEYHRLQTFKNQLESKFQSLEDQLTGFIKKATKSIEAAKNKPQSSQLHADVEYSDEDDIVQVDAEDSDPDVAAAIFRFVNGRCQHEQSLPTLYPFVSLCVPHINYTSNINLVFNGKVLIRISSVV